LYDLFAWGDKTKKFPSARDTRNIVWATIKEDLKHVPEKIGAEAILEAHKAFWSQIRAKKGNRNFRSRKAPEQSCVIHKNGIKTQTLFPRFLGKKLRSSEPWGEPAMARLVWRYGE
jgi:hypothetical protein